MARRTFHPRSNSLSPILLAELPTAARFDFPIGSENGAFAYNAQPFTENRHLGDDLNGIGGENSDQGDPVFAVADGRVIFAGGSGPGLGQRDHRPPRLRGKRGAKIRAVILRTHRDDHGRAEAAVRRGQQIATIGTAEGRYWAHLHFEMREFQTPFIGPGYREDTRGWIDPSAFIAAHRGAPEDDLGRTGLMAPR